jgi:hypothetical protein
VADAVLEKVPAGQLVQVEDARADEYAPAGQALQLVTRAEAADAVPRGQGMHDAAPGAGEKEPGAHGVHEEEDCALMAEDDVPAGHMMQAVALALA